MPFSHYRLGRKDGGIPDVFIATPCNSGRPCCNYTMALVDSATYMQENGVKFDYWLHTEDCHVDDARNFLVAQFLKSGAPYLVFIDDDVGWATEDLAKLLCYKDADIVGGAYPLKQRNEDYPVRVRSDVKTMQARKDGLLEVDGVPTGFMRVSRNVILSLAEKRKHMTFLPKEAKEGDDKLQVIFERMMVEGRRWSGDLNFCREARLLGFRVWVAPEMTFTHQGQLRWEGNLGEYLRKKNGVLDSRLDAAMEKLITGDNSPEVFNDIFKYHGNEFSMGPHSLKTIYDKCKDATGPILEVGSGITTIIAGLACQRNGQMVHALEHDIEWFRKIRNFIQLWKVKSIALYYAPLKEYPELSEPDAKQPPMWYSDFDDLPEKFEIAILDGPPRRFGRESVYKLILDRIKDATWIVDDCDDPVQLELTKKYAEPLGKKVEVLGAQIKGRRNYAVVT